MESAQFKKKKKSTAALKCAFCWVTADHVTPERDRDRERQRQTDRQTGRQAVSQIDRHRQRQRDRETE